MTSEIIHNPLTTLHNIQINKQHNDQRSPKHHINTYLS